jgi:EAL domain-containing protein (putative c-di-GMP-specific phosphodiesterase class I)
MPHQKATDPWAEADPKVQTLLRGLGLAPYEWRIGSDGLDWSGDPVGLTQYRAADLATGAAWHDLIAPLSGTPRATCVMSATGRDTGVGVAFSTSYAIRQRSGARLQVEDCGRWFSGPSGAPALVRGLVRRLGEPDAASLRSATSSDPALSALQGAIERAASHAGSSLLLVMDPAASRLPGFDGTSPMLRRLREVMRRGDSVVIVPDGLVAITLAGCSDEAAREAAARLAVVASSDHPDWRIKVGAMRLGPAITAAEALRGAKAALLRSSRPSAEGFVLLRERRAARPASGKSAAPGAVPATGGSRKAVASAQRDAMRVLNALNDREIRLGRHPGVSATGRALAWEQAMPMLRRGTRRLDPLRAGLAPEALPDFEAGALARLVEHRCLELVLEHLRETPSGRLRLPVSPAALCCRNWHMLLAAGLIERPDLALRLIVDIDEAALAARIPALLKGLACLRDQGVGLMLSCFGRGGLSLPEVAGMGMEVVVLHPALIAGLKSSSDVRFLVKTLITGLRSFGLRIGADGVPDEETATLAASLGVDVLCGEIAGDLEHASKKGNPASRKKHATTIG